MQARDYCRAFEKYARGYYAGAFAAPLIKEIEIALAEGRIHYVKKEGQTVFAAFEERPSAKVLSRRDFTGDRYVIPAGKRVISHTFRSGKPSLEVSKLLSQFDYIYTYQEDGDLLAVLRSQGFQRKAIAISASSEIKGIYTNGQDTTSYADWDVATLCQAPLPINLGTRKAIIGEVNSIQGWRDDFPYYHNGTWSQACLRGYNKEDPFWGVKPSEMSRIWKLEHPEDSQRNECDWTGLYQRTPNLVHLIKSVAWWNNLERVRLLRMHSADKSGQLRRHTDITDRSAGTRDGQICRFHLPLITHDGAVMKSWDLEGKESITHLQPWCLYYLDQRKPHAVFVPKGVTRVHLVVDVVASAEVRARLKQENPGDLCRRG